MTKMEQRIIAHANELGYFPTRQQASAIWDRINLAIADEKVR